MQEPVDVAEVGDRIAESRRPVVVGAAAVGGGLDRRRYDGSPQAGIAGGGVALVACPPARDVFELLGGRAAGDRTPVPRRPLRAERVTSAVARRGAV